MAYMRKGEDNICHYNNSQSQPNICSNSGKIPMKYRIKHLWQKIENCFFFIALASLFWLLYKSGSKPSRITYPCQRAAAANLSTLAILFPIIYGKKIKDFLSKYKLSILYLSILFTAYIFGTFYYDSDANNKAIDSPTEYGINGKDLSPSDQVKLGTQSEIETVPAAYDLPSPHRVVTVHNSNSSTWEGEGNPNNYMNQTEIDKMVDFGIMELTGTASPQDGWRKIIPYTPGQSVAIKVNFNNNWNYSDGFDFNDYSDTSMLNYAAVVNSVIRGLKSIGVPSDKIWITDPSRTVHDQFRERIFEKEVHYYVNKNSGPNIEGRPNIFLTDYVSDNSEYASTSTAYDEKIRPAQVFVDATYIINMPQLKGHHFESVGKVTLALKNNFGSVSYTEAARGSSPAHKADSFAKLLADINNNIIFRNKTRLVVGDGIMGNPDVNTAPPTLWSSFGNKPPETLFLGVDPVATDCVMINYIRREAGSQHTGLAESYAAELGLGVSESWNDQEMYSYIDHHPINLDNQIYNPVSDSKSGTGEQMIPKSPEPRITFVTTGPSFSPIITVTGNPEIEWIFGDGSTSGSPSPVVNFSSARTRKNTLVVTPWSAVTKINIGYDGSDGGVAPNSSTIAYLPQQNVTAVSGLENVAPYLQVWASSYNPITELDFSNFNMLHTIECFSCSSLTTIRLRNVPALTRLCVERCNISHLDLSEAPSLADLRGACQGSQTYRINWGTTGANLWHLCVRDNPQMTSILPLSQFPVLSELFIWNDNQSGTLHPTSTSLRVVSADNNFYNAADFSGCFPAGRDGSVSIRNNNLTSIEISNSPGLRYIDFGNNSLNQTAVDCVLQTLDSYNTFDGSLNLIGNTAPSSLGIAHANNLTARRFNIETS
jgi:hypothetical protein